MIDRLLVLRFKYGSKKALCDIYTKYEDVMLTVAVSLLNDISAAEDVVHDVFVNFAQSASKIRPNGNLRGYLTTCVANLARDRIRAQHRQTKAGLDISKTVNHEWDWPLQNLIDDEQFWKMNNAMSGLPYEQKEVITLHLQGNITFKEIAILQNVSISTVHSRYRYGLEKLRSILYNEVEE